MFRKLELLNYGQNYGHFGYSLRSKTIIQNDDVNVYQFGAYFSQTDLVLCISWVHQQGKHQFCFGKENNIRKPQLPDGKA